MADPKWTNGKWKDSVSLLADLPLTGNSDGDCREVLEPTGPGSMPIVYCWDEDLPGPNKWFPATLSGPPSPHTHPSTDITDKGLANGVASLDAAALVVENPASATAVPAPSSIVISDLANEIDAWGAAPTGAVGVVWAVAAPTTIRDAIDRMAAAIAGLLAGPIP